MLNMTTGPICFHISKLKESMYKRSSFIPLFKNYSVIKVSKFVKLWNTTITRDKPQQLKNSVTCDPCKQNLTEASAIQQTNSIQSKNMNNSYKISM
jgi:hypothetical protein